METWVVEIAFFDADLKERMSVINHHECLRWGTIQETKWIKMVLGFKVTNVRGRDWWRCAHRDIELRRSYQRRFLSDVNNRKKVNAYKRALYARSIERGKVLRKAYYERNKEKVKVRARVYRALIKARAIENRGVDVHREHHGLETVSETIS